MSEASGRRPCVGLMIPEFPQQTHIAWWRVGDAFRELGVDMRMLSTVRPPASSKVHDRLNAEAEQAFYVWPPRLATLIRAATVDLPRTVRGLSYVFGLSESGPTEKVRALAFVLSALELRAYCRSVGIDRVFVHSCANAAHVAAICRAMGGPRYALRLGGDLHVYGKDHASKMRRADFVLAAAPVHLDDVRAAGVEEERLDWSWVGVDLSQCAPGASWPERSAEAPLNLVTVARLNPVKGHADVLAALKRLRDAGVETRYAILGGGPEDESLRRQVQELGLEDVVEFTGAVDTAEVVRRLQAADVHVLASFGVGEAAPAAVCEAMACGIPAICTRIGATPLMVRDGVDGYLVAQRDVDGLAEAIGRLARDAESLVAMKCAARDRSAAFDVRRTAGRILARFALAPAP